MPSISNITYMYDHAVVQSILYSQQSRSLPKSLYMTPVVQTWRDTVWSGNVSVVKIFDAPHKEASTLTFGDGSVCVVYE